MAKSDIEIAQEAKLENIENVAASLGIDKDEIELYGKYKAKLSDEYINRVIRFGYWKDIAVMLKGQAAESFREAAFGQRQIDADRI